MSDDRLRLLERRAAGSGDVVDRAAVLSERRRRGVLSSDQLGVAALCGDQASRLVVGLPLVVDRPARPSRTKGFTVTDWAAGADNRSLSDFVHGLTFWEDVAPLWFLVGAARATLLVWTRRFGVRKLADGTEETIATGPCGDARCCPHASGPPACLHHERARPRLAIESVEAWLRSVEACRANPDEPCSTSHEMAEAIRRNPEVVVRSGGKRTGEAWWGGLISASLWIIDGIDREANQGWLTVLDDTALGCEDFAGERARRAGCAAVVSWALGEPQ